jgi:hypothetical protein
MENSEPQPIEQIISSQVKAKAGKSVILTLFGKALQRKNFITLLKKHI